MTRLAFGLCIAAAIATSTLAATAHAASTPAVVPPENSAAAQYTEAVPTAGGDKPTGGGAGGHRSPAKILGSHNAHKLNAQGKSGHEVAEVVAATAPETSPGEPQVAAGASPSETSASARGGAGATRHTHGEHAKGQSVGSGPAPQKVPLTELPNGSSGLGEVLAAATGSTSEGQLGALLPLAIAASIAWSLTYLWRQRRRTG
jgi:hypothetical protein